MDYLFEESKEDRLIDDYLFSGYRSLSGKSAFEADQQFAKPIQDEDLFGCVLTEEPKECSVDDRQLSDAGSEADVVFGKLLDNDHDGNEKFEECLFEDDSSDALNKKFHDDPYGEEDEPVGQSNTKPSNTSMIDDIFIDDYSSPALDTRPKLDYSTTKAQQLRGTNNENAGPENHATKESEGLMRVAKLKERILQQAKAIGKPTKLGSGFGEDDEIELSVGPAKSIEGSNIFKKLINRSTNLKDGTPEKVKRSWDEEKDSLIKRICADKRKIWDSFQRPVDEFDEDILDEEEEPSRVKSLEAGASKDDDNMLEPPDDAGSISPANDDSSQPVHEPDDSSGGFDDVLKEDAGEPEDDSDELEEDSDEPEEESDDEHEIQRIRVENVDEKSDDESDEDFPPKPIDENRSKLPNQLDDDDCQSSESSF